MQITYLKFFPYLEALKNIQKFVVWGLQPKPEVQTVVTKYAVGEGLPEPHLLDP